MNDAYNKALIAGHEGTRLQAYHDSRGFLTIGKGFNLDSPSAPAICQALGIDYQAIRAGALITQAQCDAIFEVQYDAVSAQALHVFPAIDTYPSQAQAVVCDMLFELGFVGFMKFRHFIAFIGTGAWKLAAAEILSSALDREVPNRAKENIALLEGITA